MSVRETLFGDMPLAAWPSSNSPSTDPPWSAFAAARSQLATGDHAAAVALWREVTARPGLESRHYLQAWHFLRGAAHEPPPEIAKQVLGVVVEVAMPGGLDLLAAYRDHSARYYNYSGAGVVWEHPDAALDSIIDELLVAAGQIVDRIDRWDGPRPPAPPLDEARLCFLTPSGLHFGQGPIEALAEDRLAARVFYVAEVLMKALIAKTK